MLVVAGFPAQVAEATEVIGRAKLTTMVWLPVGLPPARHSMPGGPERGRLISKVPALPWVFRETAPVAATGLTVVMAVAVLLLRVGSLVAAVTVAVFVRVPDALLATRSEEH